MKKAISNILVMSFIVMIVVVGVLSVSIYHTNKRIGGLEKRLILAEDSIIAIAQEGAETSRLAKTLGYRYLAEAMQKDVEATEAIEPEVPVEPNYLSDIFYTLQVPVSVYPQVTEKDVSNEDWSVRSSYDSIIATLPKGHQIQIIAHKFCNRTNSWWLEVEYRNPYAVGFGSRETGWVNNDALLECPPIVSEKK